MRRCLGASRTVAEWPCGVARCLSSVCYSTTRQGHSGEHYRFLAAGGYCLGACTSCRPLCTYTEMYFVSHTISYVGQRFPIGAERRARRARPARPHRERANWRRESVSKNLQAAQRRSVPAHAAAAVLRVHAPTQRPRLKRHDTKPTNCQRPINGQASVSTRAKRSRQSLLRHATPSGLWCLGSVTGLDPEVCD